MIPAQMEANILTAGSMLCVMSIVDTLAYAVRTAGVRVRRLAISISLFNILTIFSRMSNLIQAPILANLPDKVKQQVFTPAEVHAGLNCALLFIAGGVMIGAVLTPSFYRLAGRGISVLERKGSLIPTLFHGLRHLNRLPYYMSFPHPRRLREYLDVRRIPGGFLIFNIFVTGFYSIGVMSTLLAASLRPDLSVTIASLSGIVNGIATMLFFLIVDPPAAVLIDHCITGRRPVSDAVTMNIYLAATRLLGIFVGMLLLPVMAEYVMWAAGLVDRVF